MFKRLLVPLDGSTLAEKALDYAISLAQHYGARLDLLEVVPIAVWEWEGEMRAERPEMVDQVQEKETTEASDYLRRKEADVQAQGLAVNAYVVRGQSIAEAIIDTCEELECDVIVMSTHGLTGLQRWLIGSVAERVVRHATVPVFLIRTQQGA